VPLLQGAVFAEAFGGLDDAAVAVFEFAGVAVVVGAVMLPPLVSAQALPALRTVPSLSVLTRGRELLSLEEI
jgi:hypothetical protein